MTNLGDLRAIWLEAFVATADTRKRTAAGEEIGLDQATVTKHIRKLEAWIRTPLLESGSSPAELTPAGKDFLPQARKVVETLRKVRQPTISEPTVATPKASGRDIKI